MDTFLFVGLSFHPLPHCPHSEVDQWSLFWSGRYFVTSRYFDEANSVADALANWVAVLRNSILPASIYMSYSARFFEVSNNQIR